MTLLAGLPFLAVADAQSDFEAGKKAFDRGDVSGSMAPLRRAADAGHAKAQALYGYVLDISEFNVDAYAYYKKAADQGDADGQYGLAQMYITGEAGKKDLKQARAWMEKAAAQGQAQAITTLADAYISGALAIEPAEQESPQALKVVQAAADLNSLTALMALQAAYTTGKYGLPIDPAKAAELEAKIRAIKPDLGGRKKRRSL